MTIMQRADLFAMGFDAREIRRQVESGRLVRVQRGYFIWAGALPDEKWRLEREIHLHRTRASVQGAKHPVVVSHVSAAIVHGLPAPRRKLDTVHLVQPGRTSGLQTSGVRRTTAPIDDGDLVEVDGLMVTSLARTIVDLGRTLSLGWAVAAVDDALHDGKCSPDALETCLARCSGLPGVTGARRAVAMGDARAESAGESLSRVLLTQAGLAPDELQRKFPHAQGIDRVDMWWDEGVIGEFDGHQKYFANSTGGDSEDVVWAEKRREDRLRDRGNRVVRWVWEELMKTPKEVEARVRAARASKQRR